MNYLNAFAQELNTPSPQLERLALIIGGIDDLSLDIEIYLEQIENLARQVKRRMPVSAHGCTVIEALLSILRDEMDFRGNVANYYEPANSFLHRVLDRRLGLPITLSVLYMVIGRRLGIRLEGMGFPGHFMLRYEDEEGSWLLDPFYGRVVYATMAEEYLAQVLQQRIDFQYPLDIYRVTTHSLILRLLNNLRTVYLANEVYDQATEVLNFMVMVAPEEDTLWRERALLRFQSGQFLGAESDLRHFFYQRQLLHHFVENRPVGILQPFILPEVESVPFRPSGEITELLLVLDHIRTSVARLN
ncbi:MAG: transglutaminase family protein [Caldilineaceae bacterium]|nr:transglutaminase family protein [Caldilineaceae bacterium]